MLLECGRKRFEYQADDPRGGNRGRYHGQEAVAAVFGSCIGNGLHGRLRHPEKHLSDQETIAVGPCASAELDHVSEENGAVFTGQRLWVSSRRPGMVELLGGGGALGRSGASTA